MNLNWIVDFATVRGRNPLESIGPTQIAGLATVFVGISQLLIAFPVAKEQPRVLFIIMGSGWLLISIGVNVLRSRNPFESSWGEGGRMEWLSTALLVIPTVIMIAAAVSVAVICAVLNRHRAR